jgi:hypothetical protein
MGLFYQKDCESFFSIFHFFHIKEILNEIFCNLLLKIQIVALVYHMSCVSHFEEI